MRLQSLGDWVRCHHWPVCNLQLLAADQSFRWIPSRFHPLPMATGDGQVPAGTCVLDRSSAMIRRLICSLACDLKMLNWTFSLVKVGKTHYFLAYKR